MVEIFNLIYQTNYFFNDWSVVLIEKGAHFRGDSYITAHYTSLDLDSVKLQLAFSTTAVRNIAQALMLIQTNKSYDHSDENLSKLE